MELIPPFSLLNSRCDFIFGGRHVSSASAAVPSTGRRSPHLLVVYAEHQVGRRVEREVPGSEIGIDCAWPPALNRRPMAPRYSPVASRFRPAFPSFPPAAAAPFNRQFAVAARLMAAHQPVNRHRHFRVAFVNVLLFFSLLHLLLRLHHLITGH